MTKADTTVPVRVIRVVGTVDIAAVVQRAAVAATVGYGNDSLENCGEAGARGQ